MRCENGRHGGGVHILGVYGEYTKAINVEAPSVGAVFGSATFSGLYTHGRCAMGAQDETPVQKGVETDFHLISRMMRRNP